MTRRAPSFPHALILTGLALQLGCNSDASIVTYTVGGNLSGLGSQLNVVLRNNNTDPLEITANGAFTFPTALQSGFPYAVTVDTQPATQQCLVSSGTGTLASANITSVQVACSAFGPFTVGGTLTGLPSGNSVPVVLLNGTDAVSVTQNGAFTFPTALYDDTSYNVTVASTPVSVTCGIANAGGAIEGSNVTTVVVTCQPVVNPTFSVGGTVQGLDGNVTLQNSNGDSLTVTASGPFAFNQGMASGVPYAITVTSQPVGQSCIVQNGLGTVQTSAITNVVVKCTDLPPSTYTVGGSITGLQGTIILQNTINGDVHQQNADGTYTFPTQLSTNSNYNVVILNEPDLQTCTFVNNNATGKVASTDITTINVVCTASSAPTYALGGTVTGLAQFFTTGVSLTLQDTWGANSNTVTVTQSGAFAFPTRLPNAAAWTVAISGGNPTNYSCSVNPNSGTINAADFTSIAVACSPTVAYTVGGTISGLSGTLLLQNNAGDTLTVSSGSTTYQFNTSHGYGAPYNITVLTNPSGQLCTVSGGSGTISSDVSVPITCSTSYTVGGQLHNVAPATPLTLAVDGVATENYSASGSGTFHFNTQLLNGQTYIVGVRPTDNQNCTVFNGSGTMLPAAVNTVNVTCATYVTMQMGQAASYVLGQANLTTGTSNRGLSANSNTLNLPIGNSVILSDSVAYLPDSENNRLVTYAGLTSNPNEAGASLVLGQPDFQTTAGSVSQSSFFQPTSATSDGTALLVADTNNNRVLVYQSLPGSGNPSADAVLGQSSFLGNGAGCSGGFSLPGSVYLVPGGGPVLVADTNNNRVLIWNTLPADNTVSPNVVLGQTNATTCGGSGSATANNLSSPGDVWSDGQRVFVADTGHNRVLLWNTFPTVNGQAADVVIGQSTMTSSDAHVTATGLSAPSYLATNGLQLFVTDTGNNRTVEYYPIPSANGAAAVLALGQSSLTANTTGICVGLTSTSSTLCAPSGVSLQGKRLWVTDTGYSRYVGFVGQ